MRRWIGLGVALVVVGLWASGSQAGMIGPRLQGILSTASPDQKIPVNIALKQQADNAALEKACARMTKEGRWAYVVSELKRLSEVTQRDLLSSLAVQEGIGQVSRVSPLWIVNAVGCDATPGAIQSLAARSEVWYVEYDRVGATLNAERAGSATGEGSSDPPGVRSTEPNVRVVGADSVWNLLGYNGDNVIVGEVDTGIRYTHLDLVGHMWNSSVYPNHGFNFASNQFTRGGNVGPSPYDSLTPLDYYGHGSHCAGIVSGDGAYGNGVRDTVGVAPKARMMSVPVDVYLHAPFPDTAMENETMEGMQFCVSPTRDPSNHAQVITMSLGLVASWLPVRALWRQAETNIMTAGIVHCVAAGNEGPTARSIRTPGDVPGPWHHPSDGTGGQSGVISIGATDNSDNAASFTSIGPADWGSVPPYNDYVYPPGLNRPDVAAPGVNIFSTYNTNDQSYTTMSGTSMATPCAAGVVALMLDKNPTLLPWQVDSILQRSVRPLGTQPKNNTFGTGRISAYQAVLNTPLPGPQHDVGIQSIQTPGVKVDPLVAIAPQVRVTNAGTYRETNVPVRFRVDSAGTQVYNNLYTIPTLDSAATVTVTFANWTPGPGGNTYNLMTYHSYSPDTNRANDTLKAVTQTRVHDVRSISSSIGSRVRALSPVTPQLTLGSADYTERSFNATCWIDSGATRIYTQTVPVDSVVASGTKTVAFPVWNTGPVGANYNLTFFHTFADPIRTNDTLRVTTQASNQSKALIAHCNTNAAYAWALRDTLVAHDSSNIFSAIDTINVSSNGGRILSLNNLITSGYSVVLTYTDYGYLNSTAMGDTLAAFMDQGGGVVVAVFADQNGIQIGGRYASQYMPLPTNSNTYGPGTLGTVHLPTHPIMAGVSAISVGSYVTAATTLQRGVEVADFNNNSILAAAYDTVGRRTAAIGFFPTTWFYSSWGGHNARLLLNAMCWAAGLCNESGVEVLPPIGNMPKIFALASARPNPLRGTTEIRYQLPTSGPVRITVFNVAGQAVRTLVDAKEDAGYKSVTWNGRNNRGVRVGAGVYLYRMEAGSFTATKKLVVVR